MITDLCGSDGRVKEQSNASAQLAGVPSGPSQRESTRQHLQDISGDNIMNDGNISHVDVLTLYTGTRNRQIHA